MGAKLSSPTAHGAKLYGNTTLKEKVGLFSTISFSHGYSPAAYRDDEFGKIPNNQKTRDVSRAQTRGQYMRFQNRESRFQKTGSYSTAGVSTELAYDGGYAASSPSHRTYSVSLAGRTQDVSFHDVLEHFRSTASESKLTVMKGNYNDARQYWKTQVFDAYPDVGGESDAFSSKGERYKRTVKYQQYVDRKYTESDIKFHAVTQELATRKRVNTMRKNRRKSKQSDENKE